MTQPEVDRTIVFKPNLEKEFTINLFNAPSIETVLFAGALTEYCSIIDADPAGGPRSVKLRIAFPQSIEPGVYMIQYGGRERVDNGDGTIGARAGVLSQITVIALREESYPVQNVYIPDIAIMDKANITVSVENLGYQDIAIAQATIKIYDETETLVAELKTDMKGVESRNTNPNAAVLRAILDNTVVQLKPGAYHAVSELYYDGKIVNTSNTALFRVGTLKVSVTDYTKEYIVNATNKVKLTITSDWTGTIKDVHANIRMPNKYTVKTPDLDLSKFQTATLEGYWETENLELGNYTMTIELFYNGNSETQTVPISIIDGIPPIIEEPKKPMNTTMMIMMGLVGLVIINILVLFVFMKRKSPPQVGSPTTPNAPQPPRL